MITLRIILRKYNWAVTILYDCNCSDIPEIIEHLKSIECSNTYINNALINLELCAKDTGFTYTNYNLNRSIMVINLCTSLEESINTIVHEAYHFILHLNIANNIDDEETLASLIGTFVMNTYKVVKELKYQ